MQTTSNLGLRKPDDDIFINIEDLNYNADIIDQKVQDALDKEIEVVNDYSGGDNKAASAEIVKNLKEEVDAKATKEELSNIPKVVVNNTLTSDSETEAISAKQGKILNETKLGKSEKAADSNLLDGHDSTYFATAAAAQNAQNTANQAVNAAAAAHQAANAAQGRADGAYQRADQAFTSASNGKLLIANTLTGMGTPTSTTASWQTIANNIGKLIKIVKLADIANINNMRGWSQKENPNQNPLYTPTDVTIVDKSSHGITLRISESYNDMGGFVTINHPIDFTPYSKMVLLNSYTQREYFHCGLCRSAISAPNENQLLSKLRFKQVRTNENIDNLYEEVVSEYNDRTIIADISDYNGIYYIFAQVTNRQYLRSVLPYGILLF